MQMKTKLKSPLTAALLAAALALPLTACENTAGVNQQSGAVMGSVIGAVAGSKIGKGRGQDLAVVVGALLGLFVGADIGASMKDPDREKLYDTTQGSLENTPIDQTTEWRNPDSGNAGTITPKRTYKTAEGVYCREFQQTVTIAGRVQEAYGKACRQADGTWKIVPL